MMKALQSFWKRGKTGYAFLLPFLLFFTVFVLAPIGIMIFLSFTNYSVLEPPSFVGLNNYKLLIFDDEIFLISLKNTFVFAFIMGPLGFILSFVLAWMINGLRGKSAFALAVYTPMVTSTIAMATVWSIFFSSDRYGLVNNLLLKLGVITNPVLWNLNEATIMPIIILLSVWKNMGIGFLAFLAGLQNLSKEQLEAGRIDGINNSFAELWYIIIPQMKPQLLFGAVMAIFQSFSVFDVAMQFAGLPSPNYAGHTIVAHLYDYAFIRFQMGYGCAVAVFLFLITFILGRIAMRIFRSE